MDFKADRKNMPQSDQYIQKACLILSNEFCLVIKLTFPNCLMFQIDRKLEMAALVYTKVIFSYQTFFM